MKEIRSKLRHSLSQLSCTARHYCTLYTPSLSCSNVNLPNLQTIITELPQSLPEHLLIVCISVQMCTDIHTCVGLNWKHSILDQGRVMC